ncbi:liver-expressed antimicrobial peptide 2-like [Betta splendens]|uniref:Liver-expressed antimicrobial peptide 2 n=1 Tax=Betta splendens TaxID=158456 RepID=A0A6P7P5T5_BETSP|nr:liver-expressed antimicrobial peptide 2-like [Betta splendens]
MRALKEKVFVFSLLLFLVFNTEVSPLPLSKDWSGLIQRTKRSLLWRWNSMKPVGASCRDHSECGTKYCRKSICSFWNST